MLLLSSGKIHTLSMSSGALKNQPKQKRGRAIALPAPPPPRSLTQGSKEKFGVPDEMEEGRRRTTYLRL